MREYKKAIFTGDGIRAEVEGFTNGFSWNGFVCPYFTKETTDSIFTELEEIEYQKVWYVAETDTYYISWQWFGLSSEEDIVSFTGTDIEVEGEIVHVYCLGEMCWYEKEEEEVYND